MEERLLRRQNMWNLQVAKSQHKKVSRYNVTCCSGASEAGTILHHMRSILQEPWKKNGQLKADPFLQVVGHPRVFVAGDISTAGPFGTAMFAGDHAACIAANIKLDNKESKMTAYKPNRPMNATQLGTTYGAGCMPGPFGSQIVMGHKMIQMIKADCFADNYWKELGHAGALGVKSELAPDAQHLQNLLHMSEADAEKLAAGLTVQEDGSSDHT